MKTVIVYPRLATMPRLIAAIIRNRPVYVAELQGRRTLARRFLLDPLVSFGMRRGTVKPLVEACPSLRHLYDAGSECDLYDVFASIEPWMNNRFGFDRTDRALGPYGTAFRAEVCDFVSRRFCTTLILDRLLGQAEATDGDVEMHGFTETDAGLVEAYGGRSFPGRTVSDPAALRVAGNALNTVMAVAYSLLWIARRIRPGFKIPDQAFVCIEYIPRDYNRTLVDEFSDSPQVVFVLRDVQNTDEEARVLSRVRTCLPTDGVFRAGSAVRTGVRMVRDTAMVLRHCAVLDPDLFYETVKLCYARAAYRGLFHRYPPSSYFARDECHADHIIRRQELNRLGAISVGNMHGFSTYASMRATFRYVSYDRYLLYGLRVKDCYEEMWAKDMEIIPVGSHGVRRSDYEKITANRPDAIGIFASIYVGNPLFEEMVAAIARAFPNRRIWLQVKANYAALDRGQAFIAACTRHENVRYTTERMLDVVHKVTYAVSDSSSCVIEGIQFGAVTFWTDICPFHKFSIYRNYPDLVVRTPEDCVRRIKEVESGAQPYPWDTFSDLIDLSGRVYYDVVREQLGLPKASNDAFADCRGAGSGKSEPAHV
jgi:hypothetical protein